MDRSFLMIVALVFAVAMVGLLTVVDFEPLDPTGMVIASNGIQDCAACSGSPVCAASGKWVTTYPSACDAACADATVIYADVCEAIPRAN